LAQGEFGSSTLSSTRSACPSSLLLARTDADMAKVQPEQQQQLLLDQQPKKGNIDYFVKWACAYVDVWFLRDTFGHDGELQVHLNEEIGVINEAFDVQNPQWKEPKYIRYTFGMYLRYMLAPSITALVRFPCLVMIIGLLTFACLTASSIHGLMHLSAEPEDLGTFKKVAHLPIVPLVLAICTHIIMMMFAHKQRRVLQHPDDNLPFPLTYTIFTGKLFMVLRMVMAYSSGEMGIAIDYFLWQELILTLMHSTLSLLIGDPRPRRQDGECKDEGGVKNYPYQLKVVFFKIFAIDSVKTLAMYFYWVSFRPGWITDLFDRIPFEQSQLSLCILIHAVLDMVQAAATMFTMFIARFGRWLVESKTNSDPNFEEASYQALGG